MYKTRLRSHTRIKQASLHINKWISNKRRNRVCHLIDPVSRDIVEPPVFKHVSALGHTTGFNAPLLVDYLVSSGNFTHPETRVAFLPCEITRLQRISKTLINLKEQRSVLEKNRADMLERQSVIEYMENDIKTSMRQILACITSFIYTDGDILYWFMMVGLPDLFNQLDQHTVFINDATQSTALLNDLAERCKSHAKTYPCSESMCKLVHNILILRLSDTTDPMDQD